MCELFAMSSRHPANVRFSLEEFSRHGGLAGPHKDGWGIEQDFDFRVKFDWPDNPDLLLDEPEPLGKRHGPNAARLVAAAVGNCLSASLVFCLRSKFKQNPGPLRASVTGQSSPETTAGATGSAA